jgi:hypothetical protein
MKFIHDSGRLEKGNFVKIKLFAFLLMASLWVGCETNKPGLYSYRDDINGDNYELITDNRLDLASNPGTQVWLNASRISKGNGTVLYYLEVHYESVGAWLNIQPGETLALNIDGQEHRYSGVGSGYTRKTTSGKLVEDATYKAGASDIRALAAARTVKVKIIGANGAIERDFMPENTARYQKFVTSYLDTK